MIDVLLLNAVAKALYEYDTRAAQPAMATPWEEVTTGVRDHYVDQATVAIKTMRDQPWALHQIEQAQ